MEHGVAQQDSARRERAPLTDCDRVAVHVRFEHVERRAAADADPAALADRVAVRAAVAGELLPSAVEHSAVALAERSVAREERVATRAGEKAEVLRVSALGDRQARTTSELANVGLAQLTEREASGQPLRRA